MIVALIFFILSVPPYDDDFSREGFIRHIYRTIIVALCLILHYLYLYNLFN